MDQACKVPRPLSLSSDDLLHEAERMFATKFVSRFPSAEKLSSSHIENNNQNSESSASSTYIQWYPQTMNSDFPSSSSASASATSAGLRVSASNMYGHDDAPTIEDDDSSRPVTPITQAESISNISEKYDVHGPLQVQQEVDLVIYRWGPVEPINPERFFLKLLSSRGYDGTLIPALKSQYCSTPRAEQIQGYDIELVTAVKNSDLGKIRNLHQSGRSMSSCNKFSESIVHMACRRASYEVAEYVLSNGGDCNIVDDYGRTPLHDACWRMEPRFDIVTLLLNSNLELLRIVDIRGSTPLKYVREEHWVQWCAYFYHQKEKYWQPKSESDRQHKRVRGL